MGRSLMVAIAQEIRIRKVLPLDVDRSNVGEAVLPIIFEPSVSDLFNDLMPRYVASEIHLAMLESQTSARGPDERHGERATHTSPGTASGGMIRHSAGSEIWAVISTVGTSSPLGVSRTQTGVTASKGVPSGRTHPTRSAEPMAYVSAT